MRSKLITITGLVILLLAVIAIGYYWYTSTFYGIHFNENHPLSREFYSDSDPNMGILAQGIENEWSKGEITAELSDLSEWLFFNTDITGDTNPEFVLYQPLENASPENVEQYGFDILFSRLIIYQLRSDRLIPVFSINREALKNEDADHLINQIPADYGYALRTTGDGFEETQEQEQSPIRFHLVILNDQHQPASDEVSIFWNPELNRYQHDTPDR